MSALARFVQSGFDPASIGPLAEDENAYRVRDRLTDDEYRILSSHLAARPDAWLWLEDNGPDVEPLKHFGGLKNLQVTSLRIVSWAGLGHVADSLEQFVVGETTLKRVSIRPMGALSGLRSLHLIGPVKDAEAIGGLRNLEELTLRSVTLPDLSLLTPMRRLRSLALLLGGTADLALLPRLESLEELELWRIRGLSDVSVLGALTGLERLSLQSMSAITSLPSLRRCASLRRLALDTMRGITDLAPVADAPALEELLLIAMPQLEAESLRPLIGHPTLRRGIWGLGSTRKNVAAYDLLPLGDPPYGHPT